MDRNALTAVIGDFVDNTELNRVTEADALRPDLVGFRMYQRPLVGVAAADDPFFEGLRRPGVVGRHFRLPGEWLPGAQTVVSFFAPFVDRVIESNRVDPQWPSTEWLHARIEGQIMINAVCSHLVAALEGEGHRAVAPSLHPDFWFWSRPAGVREGREVPGYTSNWSERHVAHVAGLGTFGLTAALITEMGSAGRLGSVVTTAEIPADARPYAKYDEYCTRCGACVDKCLVSALSLEKGKDKRTCSGFINLTKEKFAPRYGCGKCNMAVPCERGIPGRRRGA